MRNIVIALTLAALAWSAYWFIGARRAEEATANWFAARAQSGWTATHGEIRTVGFPNRLDTTIHRPRLSDPVNGLGWEAGFVQIFRLSYKPEHAIVIFPDSHVLTGPSGALAVASERMQASVVLEGGAEMQLARSNLVGEDISVKGERGSAAHLDTLLLALRKSAGADQSYDIGVEIRQFLLDSDPQVQRGSTAPSLDLRLDATFELDASIGVAGVPSSRPLLGNLRLRELAISQGPAQLRVKGTVTVDAAGALFGSLEFSVTDWPSVVELAHETGTVTPEQADLLSRSLTNLTERAARKDRVTATVRFDSGKISLDGVEIGFVPRLPLR